MRIKYLRCGICGQWARYGEICHYCGAYRLVIGGHIEYYNRSLIRMGRAIPLPVFDETTLDRVVKRAIAQYEAEQKVKAPTWREYYRKNWYHVKKMISAGKTKAQVARELGFNPRQYKRA